MSSVFYFKEFDLYQSEGVFKLTTDATLLAALFDFPNESNEQRKGLEIGTGTGVVSIMLAQRFENLVLEAIDISSEACSLARKNIQASPFGSRIKVTQADFLHWTSNKTYDVIVTNPPYFDNSTISSKSKSEALARHQIGLNYSDILVHSSRLLSVGGVLHMIFPCRYEELVRALFERTNLAPIKSIYISHHRKAKPKNMIITAMRISLGFAPKNPPETKLKFNLREETGEFSNQYRKSLKDFLLEF